MSNLVKYVYEKPVIEDGQQVGVQVFTYSEEKILKEYWLSWLQIQKQHGVDITKLTEKDCIEDWKDFYNAEYVN